MCVKPPSLGVWAKIVISDWLRGPIELPFKNIWENIGKYRETENTHFHKTHVVSQDMTNRQFLFGITIQIYQGTLLHKISEICMCYLYCKIKNGGFSCKNGYLSAEIVIFQQKWSFFRIWVCFLHIFLCDMKLITLFH